MRVLDDAAAERVGEAPGDAFGRWSDELDLHADARIFPVSVCRTGGGRKSAGVGKAPPAPSMTRRCDRHGVGLATDALPPQSSAIQLTDGAAPGAMTPSTAAVKSGQDRIGLAARPHVAAHAPPLGEPRASRTRAKCERLHAGIASADGAALRLRFATSSRRVGRVRSWMAALLQSLENAALYDESQNHARRPEAIEPS